ncbi:transcriptional regulator with XRE-family HTH domain [Streptomyces sp. LBL]|uniref:helix-turn-helix domain-containing protein n=1 Tax=Streptomyces sp. LBL TaxID=2940562 RepID=UPI002476FA25|nr:helix-turn-helix transcriptional regulator [Streptomyces sp. LBL]MDH6624657.1 transcriptional regulator with XRE-family HTH domain [Streptomyces sp. LBL]
MDPFQFGRRVNYWRTRRRMSRQEFAYLMGKSLRWVEELEGGRRQADPQLSVMRLAALRLGITLERLIADVIDTECVGQSEIDAVRRALHRHDVITGAVDDSPEEPLPVERLRPALTYARTGFQAGHFAQLGSAIPALLVNATRAAQHHRGDDRRTAYELLSLTLEFDRGRRHQVG